MKHCIVVVSAAICAFAAGVLSAEDWWKPYVPPCTERENVFAFTEKGNCDVTVGIMDPSRDLTGRGRGTVVRHLASGVLGANAPAPFQKNSLTQTLIWNGKDDLDRYVKEPEKHQVRVSLGLKPEFHKNLGNASPYDLPGWAYGITGDEGTTRWSCFLKKSRNDCLISAVLIFRYLVLIA